MIYAPRRSGFTLLELMLVIAIISILLAVSYPTLDGMYQDVKVKAAADQVREAWVEARARAIEDGRAYRFGVQQGTGRFRVAPDNSFQDGSGAGENDAPPFVHESELAGSITFDVPGDATSEAGWETVAVFSPDGSCSHDIEITLKGADDAAGLVVRVRAMTGAITVRPTRSGR